MAYRLPPLNTLRLFEAAGRHLSFKLAAEELDLTPSAVSHGVQALESWLGSRLFTRGSRGLVLTETGHSYLPPVHEALTILAAATDGVPGRRPRDRLTVSVAPTFAARLLLPRLDGFRRQHPGIAIGIDTSARQLEFPRDGVDLAIRIGDGRWPALAAVELLRESLVPVCAPALRRRLGEPVTFCEAPLIHVSTSSQDWPAWIAGAGLPAVDCRRGLRVDTLQMAFDAAARGLGIAIGRLPLVEPELTDGRLVPVCGPVVQASTAYWLVGPAETMRQPECVAFRDWLLAALAGLVAEAGPAPRGRAGRSRRGQRPAPQV